MPDFTQFDVQMMRRCLQLAAQAKGNTTPNPLVGCVVVFDGKIIGEGYHTESGKPHAEVNAINSVRHKEMLKEATLYVSLEPCSHYGKTPPCSSLIIEKEIKRVVVASVDPNPLVSGSGIERLQNAGIIVKTGLLDEEQRQLNRFFYTSFLKKRPFVILKWAQTLDGFIDKHRTSREEKAEKISGSLAQRWVHKLRTEVDAIAVGKNTFLLDNPALTARRYEGKNPIRVSFDLKEESYESARLLDSSTKTLLFTDKLLPTKLNVDYLQAPESIQELLQYLHKERIQSLLVEGGTTFLQAFIDTGLWDEVFVLESNRMLGKGVKAPLFSANFLTNDNVGKDRLYHYKKEN